MATVSNVAPLATNLVTHAFNADQSQIAIAPNSSDVHIYETKNSTDPSKWVKTHTLSAHDGFVSGIDWCGVNNKIVTCGHDRNAYVWELKEGKWENELVILKISRAATSIKWSPDGHKFAVTSGAKVVSICHWADAHDFWKGDIIKKGFKSTVLSVAWCVNSKFIVTGSSDFKCRVHSAFVDGIDPEEDDGFGQIWPKQHEFGACLATFEQAGAWINSVAWSPDGFRIAFTGHGSTVHFVQLSDTPSVQTVNCKVLPFADLEFLGENILVAGGWGLNPVVFKASGDPSTPEWAYVGMTDSAGEKKKAPEKKAKAMNMWKNMDKRGTKTKKASAFQTQHTNAITKISQSVSKPSSFWTSGLDGRMINWDLGKANDKAVSAVAADAA